MEFIVELLVEVFLELLMGAIVSAVDGRSRSKSPLLALWGFAGLGAGLGWLSALIWSNTLLPQPLQAAWVPVGAVIAALAVYLLHGKRFPDQDRTWPMAHAATFALVLSLARLMTLRAGGPA